MADWKYVMFEMNGAAVPVLFPPILVHKDVEDAMARCIRKTAIETSPKDWSSRTLSAGFCSQLVVLGTHGNSETIGIGSREQDRTLINEWPYAHGMESPMPIEQHIFEALRRGLEK